MAKKNISASEDLEKPISKSMKMESDLKTNPFLIVGLGASAGGLEAFKEFLYHLKFDSEHIALLLMSSGNYGGLNFEQVKQMIN